MASQESVEDVKGIVRRVAMEAIEIPPEKRAAYIAATIEGLRQTYAEAYQGDAAKTAAAMEFVDKLHEWIPNMLKLIETSGGGSGGTA